jgi:hypothetical protein
MLSRSTRFLGCVAGALLFGSGAVNAATLILEGSVGLSSVIDGTNTLIDADIKGSAALAYTSDYVEFEVAPSTIGTVTVDVLAGGYPSEMFRLVEASALHPEDPGAPPNTVLAPGPLPPSNVPVPFALSSGVDYFLELTSLKPTKLGAASASIEILTGGGLGTVPLPGGLVLFGTVLVGGGLFMRRRRDGGRALAV